MSRTPRELLTLERGWDSYGAEPISVRAVETAEQLEFVPLNDGGIQIVLLAGGVELEVEIGADGRPRSVLWELAA